MTKHLLQDFIPAELWSTIMSILTNINPSFKNHSLEILFNNLKLENGMSKFTAVHEYTPINIFQDPISVAGDFGKKEITFSETWANFLWGISLVTACDVQIIQKHNNDLIPLSDFALNFFMNYSNQNIAYPETLPRPFARTELTDIADLCFARSIVFYFLHELGHVNFYHSGPQSLQKEKQADDWAIAQILAGVDDTVKGNNRDNVVLGTLPAFFSQAYLYDNINHTAGTHRSAPERILAFLDASSTPPNDTFYYICYYMASRHHRVHGKLPDSKCTEILEAEIKKPVPAARRSFEDITINWQP